MIEIRAAEARDAEAMASLLSEWVYPTTGEEMRKRFERIYADSSYETLVAEREGRVIGFVGVHFERFYERNGTCARIMVLVVDEGHRGAGIGGAMISAAEGIARERGAVVAMISSRKTNSRAHKFYRRLGYEDTGFRFVKALRS